MCCPFSLYRILRVDSVYIEVLGLGSVAEFFREIVKGTKILVQKVGAFILFVFLLGMIAGAFIISAQLSLLWFVAFALAIVVTWNDFGEGVAITLLLVILLIFMPTILPPITI